MIRAGMGFAGVLAGVFVWALACSNNVSGSGAPGAGAQAGAPPADPSDGAQERPASAPAGYPAGRPAGTAAQNGGNAVTHNPDTMKRVKQAAGGDAEVAPARDVAVPNIELYWLVTRTSSGKPDGRGIAVVGGQLPWLEGEKAMEAVVVAGVSDASTLARAACFLLLQRAKLIEKPEDHPPPPLTPAQRAAITPPAKTGNVLEFWYFAGRSGTLKARVDLGTWKATSMHIGTAVEAGQDPIELAKSWLADSGDARNKMGIDKLVAECADARAPAALVETLKSHAKASTRALAAVALSKCKHASGVGALGDALGKDADAGVRKAAIEALGALADPAARPALEKAARDDADANVRSYAEWALGKLPRP
jgi:HEAT repeats